MPKRHCEDTVAFLSKKLEKVIKFMRRPSRRRIHSSDSSSSCSSGGSRSRPTSRDSTPAPDNNQDRDITEVPSPAPPPPAEAHMQAAARCPGSAAPTPRDILVSDDAVPVSTAAVSEASPATPVTEQVQDELDPDILEILGTDPTAVQKYGTDINKELANRFNHIVTKGLDKENRKQLLEKYVVPANCAHIGAPKINPEIKAAVPDLVLRRDQAIEARQTEIAAAISCLGLSISSLLKEKNKNHDLLRQLMDSGRIMCDIQYSESISRRNFALYSLKKEMKEQLINAKIDTSLFGEDLSDTIKTAKAVTKSSSDLKMDVSMKTKPAANTAENYNWRAGPAHRAAPGPSRRPSSSPPPAPAPDTRRRAPASSARSSSRRSRARTRTR